MVVNLFSGGRHIFFALLLLFVLSSSVTVSVCEAISQEEALFSITEAEHLMGQAYETILDAEEMGAEVSGLLAWLNDGAGLLSEARIAFGVKKFEEAVRFAELSSDVGVEVVGEAERLGVKASQARVERMWWLIVGSVLGVSFVLVVCWLGYGYFKRRYYNRLLGMRRRGGQA